jgi:glutathione S-transferase
MERSQCYKWTSYVITELDAPLWTIAKHRFALPSERRVPAVIETAGWEFRMAVKVLATGLEDHPYLVGDCLTVADIIVGHTLSWAKSARLALGSDQLERYLDSLLARDAAIRARERAQAPSIA